MRLSSLFSVLAIGLCSSFINAQQLPTKFSYSVNDSISPRKINYWIVDPPNGKVADTVTAHQSHFIVRLKSDPLSRAIPFARASHNQELQMEHQKFLTDLNRLEKHAAINGRLMLNPVAINFEYSEVFNGFAIETSGAIANEIRKLTDVSAVFEDKKVKAIDIASNEIIHAPSVWNELQITGKGVRIGIIDTGVDYLHADLGGGFGSSFKVKGGYDFVNNDSDPIDDNGHGTHVAGIAAANGPGLRGVAPDASIYAYKVLDRNGSGIDSWILAGIERSVDPDQNPLTDDALDVVNMSLGRAPDANEPMSEAVNNAVSKGVIFVIAAGNDYNFGSVGTPGIAEKAITVGATDNNDFTANFSSKGPTANDFRLKPDVAAPGVDINSSFFNNSYRVLSGTSMASPHVTGAVALLLEKHPDWSPEIVKSALMQTAKPSAESIFAQGAGRIDVFSAIKSEFGITPGSISLGKVDKSLPSSIITKSITLHNLGDTPKDFSLHAEGDLLNSNITVAIDKTAVTLSPNASAEINITFTIAATLGYKNYPEAFIGSIVATSGAISLKTTVTLLNPPQLKLKFTGDRPSTVFQVGIENNYYFSSTTPTSDEMNLALPAGKYDLISIYDRGTVIKESVNSSRDSTLYLDKSQAKNKVIFKPKDKSGNFLKTDYFTNGNVLFAGENRNFVTFYFGPVDTLYISDMKSYYFDYRIRDKFLTDEFYDVVISTPQGISSSEVFSNDPSAFTEITIKNSSLPGSSQQGITYFGQSSIFTSWNAEPITVPNPVKIFQTNRKPIEGYGSAKLSMLKLSPLLGQSGYTWQTNSFASYDDQTMLFYDYQNIALKTLAISDKKINYDLGESILRPNARSINQENKIRYNDVPSLGSFNHDLGDRKKGTVYYEIKTGVDVVKRGSYLNKMFDEQRSDYNIDYSATPGPYTLSLKYDDNYVMGRLGTALANLQFNLALEDRNPPTLQKFSLEVNGKSVNHFEASETGTIKISIADNCFVYYSSDQCSDFNQGIKGVKLQIKKSESTEWVNLTASKLSNDWETIQNYESNLQAGMEAGYYDIKIIATDKHDNSLDYELKPGFLIGPGDAQVNGIINLMEPKQDAIGTGVTPLFKWSGLDNALTYTLQISESESFTDITEYLVSANSYQAGIELKDDQFYYWRVLGIYETYQTPWSHTYKFYTGNPFQKASLLKPINNAEISDNSIKFIWSHVKDADLYYKIELSLVEDFAYLYYLNYVPDTVLTINNIAPGLKYYWRVTSNNPFNNRYYEVLSEVGYFYSYYRQINSIVSLIEPKQNAIETGVTPLFKWSALDNAPTYKLQISESALFTPYLEYQVSANSFQTLTELKNNQFYYWRVLGKYGTYETKWSSTHDFYTGLPSLELTRLLRPIDNSEVRQTSVEFKWSHVKDAGQYYKIELSTVDDFSSLYHSSYVADTAVTIYNILPDSKYYWRVTSNNRFYNNYFDVLSTVSSFHTKTETVTGLEKSLGSELFSNYPNPFTKETFIKFYIDHPGESVLTIIDAYGREIRKFINYASHAGVETIAWNGTNSVGENVSPGIYIGLLQLGSNVKQRKISLTR